MASGSEHEGFVRELLDALRHDTFTRNPNASDRLNNFAENVKRRLDALTTILDERGLQYYTGAIDLAESLKARLERSMSNRRNARATSIVGNILRIGGTVSYATPIGQVVFWGGFAVSTFSDMMASHLGNDINNLSSQIRAILERDHESFRAAATAIRNLDEAIESETGWSLYEEEFQEFLRNATEAPERDQNRLICRVENAEHRTNLMEVARNRDLLTTLNTIIEAFQREDIILLTTVTQFLLAASFIESTAVEGAAIQVGELTVRGLTLYIEYKKDKLALEEFEQGIARMRKELKALRKVYPDL